MFKREIPYNDLPLLPPDTNLETKEILKASIAANRAVAELKGVAKTIPNQTVLVNTLPLQEARASSEIENIFTTNDKLYEAFVSLKNNYDLQTKEVLRYREALWTGFNDLNERKLLTTNLFVKIYQIIKETDSDIRKTIGTRISNSEGNVLYTPPEGESVIRDKLKNLEDFIHSDNELDDLIKLALIHYQFEAIHPFTDGNGRTGRIINVLFLIMKNHLDLPILYLSKYIIENKTEYYVKLRNVTEKSEWREWILYMLKAIEETAIFTAERILAIKNEIDSAGQLAKSKLPGRVFSKELIELIFEQPYCKVDFVVKAGIAKRQTAANYLKVLENEGFLESKKVGKEMLYLNSRLINILTNQ